MKTKSMPQDVRAACIKCYENLLETGEVLSGDATIYDELSRYGFINLNDSQKRKYYEQAQDFLVRIENAKPKNQRRPELYSGKRKLSSIFRAKAMILEDYFANIESEGKHLKEII